MRLRERFTLTLIGITLILIAPAVYGIFAMQDLNRVAQTLQGRDAIAALNLGRLQTAFGELESAARIYVALGGVDGREEHRLQVDRNAERVRVALESLRDGGYSTAVQPATAAWRDLAAALQEEQRLVEAQQLAAADEHREQRVVPAFTAMDATLEPIGRAIDTAGDVEVQRARSIAETGATTMIVALGIALLIAVLIAMWLTRAFLRPIHSLRTSMAEVARGDLAPEVDIDPGRRDEIGDLGRSFRWMTNQLGELERLRAQFVAVASHELKTPLSVIKGYVSLIREGIYGEITEEQEKVLTSVSDQSDRLGRLIQQLLDISRFEAGGGRLDIQGIQLRPFLQELSVSFEALALQNQIDFECEIDPSLPEAIEGDPDRLNEVVGNLLSNAFKFTPRDGWIRLRARASPGRPGEEVELAVCDSGIGISPDELHRIFEKFYQVENAAQPLSSGSGLGLAISKEIVEAHGGTISAESTVGKGTTFRVSLPMSPQQRLEEASLQEIQRV
jgi:signal transduction histidine kinase